MLTSFWLKVWLSASQRVVGWWFGNRVSPGDRALVVARIDALNAERARR